MVDDPYKVLGISEDASKEEIKKAYRRKAKEYHPDLHPDDPVSAQKMNEVNEAYDMLCHPEKYQRARQRQGGNPYGSGGAYGSSGSAYGQGQSAQGGYGGAGGYGPFDFDDFFGYGRANDTIPNPSVQPGDSISIQKAVDDINSGRYVYAARTLNTIVSSERNGRWLYLSALANYGQGNVLLAAEQMEKALQIEPGNPVYRQTLQAMRQNGRAYNTAGQNYQQYSDGMGSFCRNYFAAQLCCMFCYCC